jgi:hypothetical protein
VPPFDGHHLDEIALADIARLEVAHEFVEELVVLLLILAFEDEIRGVASMLAGILRRSILAGIGTGTCGFLSIEPIGLYLLESSQKIGFVSSKVIWDQTGDSGPIRGRRRAARLNPENGAGRVRNYISSMKKRPRAGRSLRWGDPGRHGHRITSYFSGPD